MKKFLKNKKICIAIIIILLSGLFIIANKAARNYNEEIITEENISAENESSKEKNNAVTEDNGDIKEEEDAETEADFFEEDVAKSNSETVDEEKEKIYVYVTGQVNIPGVVILDKGSRISDAINAAGGTTAKANTTKINLVYVLEDGMKVNIPSNEELKKDTKFEYITKDSGDGADDENTLKEEDKGSTTKKERSSNIVNINTATQTELETLPGIGPSTALKIINYRKENGKFSNIEDLKNVNGIGENKFEALKKYITV